MKGVPKSAEYLISDYSTDKEHTTMHCVSISSTLSCLGVNRQYLRGRLEVGVSQVLSRGVEEISETSERLGHTCQVVTLSR